MNAFRGRACRDPVICMPSSSRLPSSYSAFPPFVPPLLYLYYIPPLQARSPRRKDNPPSHRPAPPWGFCLFSGDNGRRRRGTKEEGEWENEGLNRLKDEMIIWECIDNGEKDKKSYWRWVENIWGLNKWWIWGCINSRILKNNMRWWWLRTMIGTDWDRTRIENHVVKIKTRLSWINEDYWT